MGKGSYLIPFGYYHLGNYCFLDSHDSSFGARNRENTVLLTSEIQMFPEHCRLVIVVPKNHLSLYKEKNKTDLKQTQIIRPKSPQTQKLYDIMT